MPKGRMLNKKISYDERVGGLSLKATLLYTWCLPHLDVKGRIYADPPILKGLVVPYRKEFTPQIIRWCVEEFKKQDLVIVYGNNYKYMQFKGFTKNQTIKEDREAPSEIPDPTPEQLQSNSGATPAKVKLSKDNISKSASLNFTQEFDKIYSKYPKKVGRKAALRHFTVSVKTKSDIERIYKALENYKASKRVAKGYVMNASTFFNQWEDWVDYTEPICPKCKGKGRYTTERGYDIICDCEDGKKIK